MSTNNERSFASVAHFLILHFSLCGSNISEGSSQNGVRKEGFPGQFLVTAGRNTWQTEEDGCGQVEFGLSTLLSLQYFSNSLAFTVID